MAETEIHKYSAGEKLNKMDVDLIEIELTTTAATHATGDVIAISEEISNAVAVNGGSAIIQSIMLLDEDYEAPVVDLIFSSADTAIGSATSEVINISDANARNLQGFVTMSNYTDLAASSMAIKTNIGLVVKAASGTTSIYVHTVNRSGGNYTPAAVADLKLRIGIIKD